MYKNKQLMYLTVTKTANTLVHGCWQENYPNIQRVGAVGIDVDLEDPEFITVSACMVSKNDQFVTKIARNRAVGRLNSPDQSCNILRAQLPNIKECIKYLALDHPNNYFNDIDWDAMQHKFNSAVNIMLERKGIIPQREINYN
jgi:hypothetical protein